jgi:hypothetical protein
MGHHFCIEATSINSFNPALMRPDRRQIIKYSRLSDSTNTNLSSQRQYFVPTLRECALCHLISFNHKKTVFPIMKDPVTWFPSECIAVNHLHSTLSNCNNLGSINVCHFNRPFTLALNAINNYNWSSWIVEYPIFYEHQSLHLSPLSSPSNDSS